MADSASVRSGLRSLMQDHLSDRLVSLLFNTMPLLYFLLGKDGNKAPSLTNAGASFGLGRPGVGALFSGVPVSRARKEQVLNSDKYMPIVQTTGPAESDGKAMGMYDTMPARSSWSTTSPTTYVSRPFFKWFERADPIMVPKKDIRRTKRAAGNEQKASAAVGDLFRFESENVLNTHINWINKRLWNRPASGGAAVAGTDYPTSVDADVWDTFYPIRYACSSSGVYGGVDRSAGSAWWRGGGVDGNGVITAHQPAVLEDLVNKALYTYGLATKGVGANLVICGVDLWPQFKAEAKAKGGVVFYDGKLPGFGEFGFKREVVLYNNTYVVMDPQCPSANGPGTANTADDKNSVVVLNLDTWTLAVSPDANFSVDEPFDLSKTEGGKDAIKSQVRTEFMVACEAPSMNVWFDDVG